MENKKIIYLKGLTIRAFVIVTIAICAGLLNYLMWTYKPDTSFETLETLLLPIVKPIISLYTIVLVLLSFVDKHTIRVVP